jgi:5'(3')-deoxyribonucleotidase
VRKVFLDLDGVVADFEAGMLASGYSDPKLFKLVPEAYDHLPVYPGAAEAIAYFEAAGFDVWIASKIPHENPRAAYGKLLWVKEHFPHLVEKVIITPNKGVLGDEYDILIDDRIHKAHCLEFKGRLIEFVGGWESVWKVLGRRLVA